LGIPDVKSGPFACVPRHRRSDAATSLVGCCDVAHRELRQSAEEGAESLDARAREVATGILRDHFGLVGAFSQEHRHLGERRVS